MCNRLDTIPACDRQTDGQTSCDGIVRAIHIRRAVKTILKSRVAAPTGAQYMYMGFSRRNKIPPHTISIAYNPVPASGL